MTIVTKSSVVRLFAEQHGIPHTDLSQPKVHNKHHRTAPAEAIYVGRGSSWGNPFVIGKDSTRDEVIELYRIHILPTVDLTPLKGRHLVCFCKPQACHGNLLLEAANS